MANQNKSLEIEKILTNGFKYTQWYQNFKKDMPNKNKLLSNKQLKTLRKYKEFYENKPSSKGGTIKVTSVLNALCSLRYLGLFLNKPYEDATKKELINWVKQLRKDGKTDSTITNFKVNMRSFYKWMHGINKKHQFPEIVDDPLLQPQRPKPSEKRSPENFLTNDEIQLMLNSAFKLRDKVLIMLTYGEASLRAAEISSLNFGSIQLKENHCIIYVPKSKSKVRHVCLVKTFPYIRDYLNIEYSLPRESDNPLFYCGAGKYTGKRISSPTVTESLKRIAKRCGIKKNVFAHMGRHQSITRIANNGLSLALNAKRAGITIDTMTKVYLHHSNNDVEKAILKINGLETDENKIQDSKEKLALMPKKCARCKQISPSDAIYCNCGFCLDEKTAIENEDKRKEIEKLYFEEMFKKKMDEMALTFIESGQANQLIKNIKK
jgi:site-specific recombinase XerD